MISAFQGMVMNIAASAAIPSSDSEFDGDASREEAERAARECRTLAHALKSDGASHVVLTVAKLTHSEIYWSFGRDGDYHEVLLDHEYDGRGFLHGDFSCPLRGPQRRDLIEFAKRARRFVEVLTKRIEVEVDEMNAATAEVLAATPEMT